MLQLAGVRTCKDENPQAEACATQIASDLEICRETKMPNLQAAHRFGNVREFPFCSARCRERDLGNWAMGKYKIAVPMMDESEPEEIDANERSHPESSDNDE